MLLNLFVASLVWCDISLAAGISYPDVTRSSPVALDKRSSTGPPCTTSSITPPPKTLKCNLRGVLKSPATPLGTSNAATIEACRDACFARPACKSLGFTSGHNPSCTLYAATLNAQRFRKSATSPTVYFARGCWKVTCPTCPTATPDYCSASQLCVSLQTDNSNCGTCGTTCGQDRHCSGGNCVCNSGLTDCSGTCVDTTSDPQHCGACTVSVGDGETCCSGQVVDLQTDSQHCGTCSKVCNTAFASCQSGGCAGPPFYILGSNSGTVADGKYYEGRDTNNVNGSVVGGFNFDNFDTSYTVQRFTSGSSDQYLTNADGQILCTSFLRYDVAGIFLVSANNCNLADYRAPLECSADPNTHVLSCTVSIPPYPIHDTFRLALGRNAASLYISNGTSNGTNNGDTTTYYFVTLTATLSGPL